MRNQNRIPIVLDLMLNKETLLHFLNTSSQKLIDNIYNYWEDVESTWKEYPDLRFGQLLCNLRLIPDMDVENHIWNVEEDDWLIKNGYCSFEDIKFWGNLYDEHNHRRDKVKFILLKDLELSHIKGIIKWFKDNGTEKQINSNYLKYFNKRINL